MALRDIAFRVFYSPNNDPLHSFYLPALAASVQYDRSAGFFRSSALAAAAAGVVRLIANGGHMRLLVGAELSPADVEAITKGYDLRDALAPGMLKALDDLADSLKRQRVEALAWMVAHGALDIKVVLPLDVYGRPIPGPAAQDYYHVKQGVFVDAEGDQVAFVGSVNESEQAWSHNYETLQVSASWESEREREALRHIRRTFDQLWDGQDPHWLAIELPHAVRQKLIRYAPDRPPTVDALERRSLASVGEVTQTPALALSPHARLLFQFLRDAPFLPGASDLGTATAPVPPWPHQLQTARAVIDRYPDRVMLCDEVGLGKTIEAGLVIRQLVLSGRVRRGLILTPASVLKQWQEELYEKFNLRIPRFDGGQVLDVDDRLVGTPTASPWDTVDLLLATSHLARRRERVKELVAAQPWDLLVVDEAHHARRRDFLQPQYRPNRLLTLLNELRDHNQYRALILMTATPMQVHPVEVWDLLMTLGLSGRWGADEANFLRFFSQLRRPYDEVDWDFVFDLMADTLGPDGQLDSAFEQAIQRQHGAALASALRELPWQSTSRQSTLRALPPEVHGTVKEMARRHTPLRQVMFRNTRSLLRDYQKRGLLKDKVPYRKPTICRIDFRRDEADLYARIADYISHFYQKYEQERRGLGFIMTVYRRRLTSSFYAVRKSLERRRDWLTGRVDAEEALTQEDRQDIEDELEDGEELAQLPFETALTPVQRQNFRLELDYLDDFINELRSLSQADSKLAQLKDHLETLFLERPTVLIFTLYTDTMDYLRDELRVVYGRAVACYSGRGGETWNGIAWVETTKEEVKKKFGTGEIRILLATEAASEGLNLQTCGVLINYDMPWNPMRVEQRIGRIDRIGQKYDWVWIYNYFYRDTIEERVYRALEDRITWFEDVVGDLQPILAEVGEVTRKLAMLPVDEQKAEFEREIRRLRKAIDEARLQSFKLDEYPQTADPDGRLHSPITLRDLEEILTQSEATRHLFAPHPELANCYVLTINREQVAVTFVPQCFDDYPETLHFLSYGSPLFDALLNTVPVPEAGTAAVVRFANWDGAPVTGWYDLRSAAPRPIATVADLRGAMNGMPVDKSVLAAEQHFREQVEATRQALGARNAAFAEQEKRTLIARARRLLVKAALVEIALGQWPELFSSESHPASFDDQTIHELRYRKSPWTWMLKIGYQTGLRPSQTDPYWLEINGLPVDKLRDRFQALTNEARSVLEAAKANGMLQEPTTLAAK